MSLCVSLSLSAGFAKIRTEETNASNWIADIIRDGTAADVTILNSGTLRADELIPVGLYRMYTPAHKPVALWL